MINIKQKEKPEKKHRKQGGAYDTLARILLGVREILFDRDFLMRNRPGFAIDEEKKLETGLISVKNIFESYFRTPSTDGINAITFGRKGDGEFRNTHFIDLNADHRTEIGDSEGYVNGVVRARISRDGEDLENRSGLYIMDRGTESSSREGTIAWLVASGEGGQVRLSYMPNKDDNPLTSATFDIFITSSGIVLFGLPSSDPGVAGAIYKDTISTSVGSYSNVLRVSTG